jgi:peroxiredoxin
MCAFRDHLQAFAGLGARVMGISVDLPWSLRTFAEHLSLTFPLRSDYNRVAVRAFGLEDPTFARGLLPGVARLAVIILDGDGTIAYRWVADVPGTEPPYDEVREAVRGLASRTAG